MPYLSAQRYRFSDQKRNTPRWQSKQCQLPTKWRKPSQQKVFGKQWRRNKMKWRIALMSQRWVKLW